jgi:two-component system sensor histidine kinase TctE
VRSLDLVALLREKVRPFAETQLRRDIDVSFIVGGTARPVECDPVLIDEMMTNLLDNAEKYGLRPGGRLDVLVDFAPLSIRICVKDDGPGIPPQMCERVLIGSFGWI